MMQEIRTKRLNLRVSQEWYDLVEKAANRNGLSMTDMIMYATGRFLDAKPAQDISFTRTKRGRRKATSGRRQVVHPDAVQAPGLDDPSKLDTGVRAKPIEITEVVCQSRASSKA